MHALDGERRHVRHARMRLFALGLSLALIACAPQAPLDPARDHVAEVVAVERAFAAEAGETGWVEAFLAHAAPDAFVLQSGPTDARAFYENIDPANRGDTSLTWAPTYAGAAQSGDLGFTTGPYNGGDTAFGSYFTVWMRQADGSLKWLYDGGTDLTTPLTPDPQGEVLVAVMSGGAGSAEVAAAAVQAAEAELAAAAAADARAAFRPFVSEYVRSRQNQPMAEGAYAAGFLLGQGPARVQFTPLRSEASDAGDMVFTLGEARWDGDSGYYARIWTHTEAGWRLAFDQIVLRDLPPTP